MTARLLSIAVACLLCSCVRNPSNVGGSTDSEPNVTNSGPNVVSSRWDVWNVTCLIGARAYRPGEPIRITVTFTPDVERELPVVALRCVLSDSANNVVRTADHDLKSLVFRQPSFHTEAVIQGAFPDPNIPDPGQFAAPDGPYDLHLMLVVDSKVVAEFDKRQISIGTPRRR
jgi:hypothetical protein